MLEQGVIGLRDIDYWMLEAVELDRAERGRIIQMRMDAIEAKGS